MPRSEQERLDDIRSSCDRIGDFVSGMSFDEFRADERTSRAVLYELIVIGEAAKGVGDEMRARFPDVPWPRMAELRDIAVHQYHGIMLDLVWDTITNRVPELRRALG